MDGYYDKNFYQNIIDQASTVPLIKIFRYYSIGCNQENHLIRCPFKSHKNGRENSASFNYYHSTNSFMCYGCRVGGPWAHAPHFVSFFDGISTYKAAQKVLSLFKDDIGDVDEEAIEAIDQDERLKIMLGLSDMIREFRKEYNDDKSNKYIEAACQRFDQIYLKLDPSNEALVSIIGDIKKYIEMYR